MSEHYDLEESWVLWFHKVEDTNWEPDSYMRLFTIKTLRDYHMMFNTIDNYTAGMFFVMREGIMPLWEDKRNVNGGMWSYKVSKKEVNKVWKNLVARCVGETLCENMEIINGLSISPKLDNCIIKIWNNDKEHSNPELIRGNCNWINAQNAFFMPCKKS